MSTLSSLGFDSGVRGHPPPPRANGPWGAISQVSTATAKANSGALQCRTGNQGGASSLPFPCQRGFFLVDVSPEGGNQEQEEEEVQPPRSSPSAPSLEASLLDSDGPGGPGS